MTLATELYALLPYAAGVFAAALAFFYALLVLLTPPPRRTRASERTYLSAASPTTPLPLPSLLRSGAPGPGKKGAEEEAEEEVELVDLSVIVPAYNETARMPSMLSDALAHLHAGAEARGGRSAEVIIVDDGSGDGTAAAALKLAQSDVVAHPPSAPGKGEEASKTVEIRVVRLVRNAGKGGAVRHGMLHARGRRLLMVDADGASRFADVEKLWAALDAIAPSAQDAGVAVGSRAHLVNTEAVVKRSFIRNVLMHGLHTVLRVLGAGHIRDTQCGFKLFTRPAARALFARQRLTNWIFDVELLLLAKQLAVPVAEVPISWHEVGGSKLSVVWDSLRMLRDLLVMRGNMLVGRWGAGAPIVVEAEGPKEE